MSSPDEDDVDKKLRLAVPWVSDPERQDLRDEETRRLQEDVIAAARRLERESDELSPPSEPGTAVSFRIATKRVQIPISSGESPEEAARRFFAQVRPEYLTPPPRQGMGLPSLAMTAAFLGAMAVSAIAALVVVNFVHQPTIRADVAGEERGAKGNSFAAATLSLAKVQEAQAKMAPADEPAVPAETLLAAVPPHDVATSEPPAATNPQPAKVEPVRPEIATPATSPVQAASPVQAVSPAPASSAAPEPRRTAALPPEETASLLKRGRDLIALGDIASARLVLTLVAEAGNSEASFILAGTFDPTVLANLRAIGVQGDPAKARAWYTRAAELGSQEARQRLQALR
jgi:hypothetical protein